MGTDDRREAEHSRNRAPPRLCLAIEQRAVERIPGGTRRHAAVQLLPIERAACCELAYRLNDAIDGLAITDIGNAFAAADATPAADVRHDNDRLALGTPRYVECARDRKDLSRHIDQLALHRILHLATGWRAPWPQSDELTACVCQE